MKEAKTKHLGLHIDKELHYKLAYLAKFEGRSVSGEVVYLARQAIAKYEAEYGKIEIEED